MPNCDFGPFPFGTMLSISYFCIVEKKSIVWVLKKAEAPKIYYFPTELQISPPNLFAGPLTSLSYSPSSFTPTPTTTVGFDQIHEKSGISQGVRRECTERVVVSIYVHDWILFVAHFESAIENDSLDQILHI